MTSHCPPAIATPWLALAIAATLALCGNSVLSGRANATPTISQGHYQEGSLVTCGSNVTSCALPYTAIPAGKTLIVQHISCTIQIGGNQSVANISVRSLANNTQHNLNFLTVTQIGTTVNNVRTFHMNDTVQLVIPGGEVPQVFTEIATPTSPYAVRCYISGQLLP
jgi:hypothetical protein